ncbi:hypothetical protein TWF106_003401 [Orbilia oligospora]|uniref:Uncharacterized protein n=1 Tax=Orbilia oligospora TaxID=2813651 RepID=A0A7C8K7V7_ORBOL|nr:hypothetical protein TWF788_001209 [Orbilia oligospora]KAF3196669.1 hypothetical protein TWF679_004562 [Orbilia oligospora]KAF3200349.1 hypothetical protein TWF106_003401 [Orbilia oligospora]
MLRRLVRSFTHGHQKSTITKDNLFDTIPADCDQECHSCTIKYPANFKIEEGSDLWQTGDEWATHLIVATGKSDWVRNVSDEKGSIMEAISKAKKPTNGKLKVSASNMCPPPEYYTESSKPTTCVILPSWTQVEMVTPDDVQELVDKFISPGPTTTTPLEPHGLQLCTTKEAKHDTTINATPEQLDAGTDHTQSTADDSISDNGTTQSEELATLTISATSCPTAADLAASSYLKSYECPHDYLILLCSHKHRDERPAR